MKGWCTIANQAYDKDNVDSDILDIIAELNLASKKPVIYDPERVQCPEGRQPVLTDDKGNLFYPKYQTDDDIVIAVKTLINTSKVSKADLLRNSKSYAKDWNLLYNLANNRSMSSSTVMKFCDLLGVKIDLTFVKITEETILNKNTEDDEQW